jgi:hypothetical protein
MRAFGPFVELAQWRCLCQDCTPWCAAERTALLLVAFSPAPTFRETTIPMPRVRLTHDAERHPPREADETPVLGLTSRTDPRLYDRLLKGLRSL